MDTETDNIKKRNGANMDTIEIYFPGGKRVYASYKGYTIHTDQPVTNGGEGTAIDPFSLFLISIGTCTGYYILSFCQKRNIPTDNIKIKLEQKINPQDNTVETINIKIDLPDRFPDNYIKALINAAESCKVKKHLEKPPRINIETNKKK
ncbi:MAG: OsmC family protein [Candidatus Thermoplasmatota archaeon]